MVISIFANWIMTKAIETLFLLNETFLTDEKLWVKIAILCKRKKLFRIIFLFVL